MTQGLVAPGWGGVDVLEIFRQILSCIDCSKIRKQDWDLLTRLLVSQMRSVEQTEKLSGFCVVAECAGPCLG